MLCCIKTVGCASSRVSVLGIRIRATIPTGCHDLRKKKKLIPFSGVVGLKYCSLVPVSLLCTSDP